MGRASGHSSPILILGCAAIGPVTDALRLCLVHQPEKAVDRRPILLLQRVPHLKPPSKKLPGRVPVLRVDGCSRLGFKPICGLWPPVQHFLHGQVTYEGCPLHAVPFAKASARLARARSRMASMRCARSSSVRVDGTSAASGPGTMPWSLP